jgi:hypothetical protein
MLEPVALILATESGLVCTRSPENRADDLSMLLPLSSAVPWLYSMAPGWSAANEAAERTRTIMQLRTLKWKGLIVTDITIVGSHC